MRRLALLLGLVGCAPPDQIPQDDFAGWAADAVCRRSRECLRGSFDSAFYGLSDCKATFERDYQELVDTMDDAGCDYDAGRAGEAFLDIDEMTCEAFYEGEANESVAGIWGDCNPGYTYTGYTRYPYYL